MRIIPLYALFFALAGCSVGPDYVRPETPSPAEWSGSTVDRAVPPPLDWWKEFGHEPLDRVMDQALRGNFDIGAAMARVQEADAQLRIASSSLFPTLFLNGGASRTGAQNLGTGKQANTNAFSIAPAVSYELDFWGKNRDSRDIAKAGLDASRFDLQTTHLTIQAGVANTYFSILALQDRLAVADDNLNNAVNTLETFKARLEVGTASGLDVVQQESIVAEQRAAIPPMRQQLRQSTFALAVLTGSLPEALTLERAALTTDTLPRVSPGLPSDLLKRRPDVQSAEAQLIAANASTKFNIASVYPSISLTGQQGVESNALRNLFDPVSLLFSIGASLAQPIYRGDALQGNIDLSKAKIQELTNSYQKSVVSAFQDVENALAAVEMTAKQEEAQKAAVATAQHAHEIVLAQMRSGTVDILTVLNVQRTLFQAQDQLVQVKLAHVQALVGLFLALGGGWTV